MEGWAYVIGLYLLLVVGPGAVTLLKGQVAAFVVGIFTLALVWMIVAFRLAKPGSWWARHLYDDRKRALAHARYG